MEKNTDFCQNALDKQIKIAQSLQETLAIINSNQELDQVLNFIVNQAHQILNADAVAIYTDNENNKRLQIEASKNLKIDYIEEAIIPLGIGATGLATLSKEPVAIEEVKNFENYANITLDEVTKPLVKKLAENFQSLLSVPLVFSSGNVYGTLNLYYRQERKFSNDDISLAIAYANQTILAIENTQLKATAKRSAMIAERNRLARELHDTVTQTLFSMSLITGVLPDLWKNNQEAGEKALEELDQLSKGALAEMRSLLFELKPNTLLSMELEALIQQLVNSFRASARIVVEYQFDPIECKVPAEVKVAFYRIVQETLRNIIKHGHASRVKVELTSTTNIKKAKKKFVDCKSPDAKISVIIEDDGIGFYPGNLTGEHYGLRIMHDRARDIGAILNIESEPGHGTRVLLIW
jgi:two-component system nitrate/nitrite sensor histidine kinase NarX